MRIAAAAVALLLATPAVAGSDERETLVVHLERTKARFVRSVANLTPAQWNHRPAEGRWTIAECAEHIAASEAFIRGAVEQSMQSPTAPELMAQGVRKDDAVLTFITDRTRKFNAPEPLQPENRFGSPEAAVLNFRKQRQATIALASSDRDFRAFAREHPGFGPLDAYGWLLFLSGHSERHTMQIEEIKASPGFPNE